jgi:hypothetical protein
VCFYIVDSTIIFCFSTKVQRKSIVPFYYNSLHIFILCTVSCCSTIQGNALLRFHDSKGYTNAPQCYVIRTLPISLFVWQGVFVIQYRLASSCECLGTGNFRKLRIFFYRYRVLAPLSVHINLCNDTTDVRLKSLVNHSFAHKM